MSNAKRRKEKQRTAKLVRWVILVAGAVPGMLFVWLKLEEPFTKMVRSAPATAIAEFALIIYLAAWVGGTNYDLEWQESALIDAPNRLRSVGSAVGAAFVLSVFFLPMCYFVENAHWRSAFLFLALFWIANLLSWRFLLVRAVKPLFDAALARASDRDVKARLRLVERHAIGSWHWLRFAVGAALSVGFAAVSASPLPRWVASQYKLSSDEVVLALMLLLFVSAVEAWIWVSRVKVIGGLSLLEDFLADD